MTIVKAGPSTWALDAAPEGATGTANVTWEVQEGTLALSGSEPLGGRPVVLSGGTLRGTPALAVPSVDPGPVTDGMAIRFDASVGVTEAGGVVTGWADSAPGADGTYDAAVDGAAVAPVWVDNAFNGNAVVRFDGTNHSEAMRFASFSLLSVSSRVSSSMNTSRLPCRRI